MNIDEFMELDKSFNPSVFINKADNIFVKLFTAVMLNELDNVKHFISEDVYKIYQEKIDNSPLNDINSTKAKLPWYMTPFE